MTRAIAIGLVVSFIASANANANAKTDVVIDTLTDWKDHTQGYGADGYDGILSGLGSSQSTFGQTFVAPDEWLESWAFTFTDHPGYPEFFGQTLVFYVGTFENEMVGEELFRLPFPSQGSDWTELTLDVGIPLVAGGSYIAYVSGREFDQIPGTNLGTTGIGAYNSQHNNPVDTYADGEMRYAFFEQRKTHPWNLAGSSIFKQQDFAFRATFGQTAVPEPSIGLGENLLKNPSFETLEDTVGLPTTFEDWGGDVTAIVSEENKVSPVGSAMIRFDATSESGAPSGRTGDVLQYVDLSGFREHVKEGRLVAMLTASFNRVQGDENTDTEFVTVLAAHDGSPESSPGQLVSLGFATDQIVTDDDVATWQESAVELEIPSTADFLQVTLSAVENVLNNFDSAEFAGQFADDASLILFIRGDFDFDADITAADIDRMSENIRTGGYERLMDLDKDGTLGITDRLLWIDEFAGTSFGDANLDGEFDSNDLIFVLQAGEYADRIVGNSGWAEGDFGGDGEFDTDDLILALQTGRYEQGSLTAAVPEPAGLGLLFLGMLTCAFGRRNIRRC